MSRRQGRPRAAPGAVRVIGGRWRGRRLPVADADALRPTPDRLRETLFNWLAPVLPGARCLDLFAGSGALGLEALSRGAAEVVLVESQPATAARLAESIERLGAGGAARLVRGEALAYLAAAAPAFDVVFLDPPYASGLLDRALATLSSRGLLAAGGLVFTEQPADAATPALPAGWSLHRESRAGRAVGRLLRASDA